MSIRDNANPPMFFTPPHYRREIYRVGEQFVTHSILPNSLYRIEYCILIQVLVILKFL